MFGAILYYKIDSKSQIISFNMPPLLKEIIQSCSPHKDIHPLKVSQHLVAILFNESLLLELSVFFGQNSQSTRKSDHHRIIYCGQKTLLPKLLSFSYHPYTQKILYQAAFSSLSVNMESWETPMCLLQVGKARLGRWLICTQPLLLLPSFAIRSNLVLVKY